MVERENTGFPAIYRWHEDISLDGGFEIVDTEPALPVAAAQSSETLLFDYCSMAVGADGSIYILSFSELWRVGPP